MGPTHCYVKYIFIFLATPFLYMFHSSLFLRKPEENLFHIVCLFSSLVPYVFCFEGGKTHKKTKQQQTTNVTIGVGILVFTGRYLKNFITMCLIIWTVSWCGRWKSKCFPGQLTTPLFSVVLSLLLAKHPSKPCSGGEQVRKQQPHTSFHSSITAPEHVAHILHVTMGA